MLCPFIFDTALLKCVSETKITRDLGLQPLFFVLNGLGVFHHKHCRYENDHAADGKDDLAGDGEHQGFEPRRVEHI